MKELILVGFGGHGKSVADTIERAGEYRIIGYTDVEDRNVPYPYLGTDDGLQMYYDSGIKYACVCIGYMGKGNVRNNLYEKLTSIGFELPVIIDPSAIVSDSAWVGEGTFIGKNSVINAEVNVGKMCIINTNSLVEHECDVGDFSHIAVGAVLCGQVKIGKGSFIGANATIVQNSELEDNAFVGANKMICCKRTEVRGDCLKTNSLTSFN